MLTDSYRPWGDAECLDVFTQQGAMEYLKAKIIIAFQRVHEPNDPTLK